MYYWISLPDCTQSNSVDPKQVFLFFVASNTSFVKYFFNKDLLSDEESADHPCSNLADTAGSIVKIINLYFK
jgi:hypothetical protein